MKDSQIPRNEQIFANISVGIAQNKRFLIIGREQEKDIEDAYQNCTFTQRSHPFHSFCLQMPPKNSQNK
jgi:hypothetical protein